MEANKNENRSKESMHTPFSQTYFHGTKADLKMGDFKGHSSEQVKAMKDGVAKAREQGIEAIED